MALTAEMGESELLSGLRAGRSSAYADLMRRNNQRLYRLARGVLGDDAEAEEAVQAGYIRAFTHIDSFKGEASVATWLARIVLNEAMMRQRRRRPTVDIDDVSEQALDAEPAAVTTRREPSPEQALARREINRAIERAVDELPAAFRSVFVLRAIEQLSIEETARALGIPEETVKSRLHRANKLLRATLAENFGAIFEDAFPFLGPRCDRLVAAV
ncbi:MAG: RNA polymerase sigma factor, partial [Stellaceae bacterium]